MAGDCYRLHRTPANWPKFITITASSLLTLSRLPAPRYCRLRLDSSEPSVVAAVCTDLWGSEYALDKHYVGGTSDRDVVADGVFTVNFEPPEAPVTQHSERTYQAAGLRRAANLRAARQRPPPEVDARPRPLPVLGRRRRCASPARA